MNKTHTNRPAGVDPKLPTQTTRVGQKGATPNYPETKPAPPVNPIKISMRAYSVKDATRAIHRAYHDAEGEIVKAMERLPENASEAQIQAVEGKIKEFITELKRETDETLEALIKPTGALHGGEQGGLPKATETSAAKERVRTQMLPESDSEMSSVGSSRTSMISTLNLPALVLEQLPREASSHTSQPLHRSKGELWAIPTPPHSSPERHAAFSKTRYDQRRLETDTSASKGKRPERGY